MRQMHLSQQLVDQWTRRSCQIMTEQLVLDSNLSREERPNDLHVTLSLLEESHMTGVIQRTPFHFVDPFKEWKHCDILHLVVAPVEEERADVDIFDIVDDSPILQISSRKQLGGPVPADHQMSGQLQSVFSILSRM